MEKDLPVRVYKSVNDEGFFMILLEGIRNMHSSNFLAFQLAKRDVKSQYRQSLLGVFWSLIAPISTAVLWLFLKRGGAVEMADTGMNYALFVFIGTLSWSIVTDSINGPISSVNAMRGTLSKINFPKEALILSSIYKTSFNILIKLVILIALLIYFQQSIGIDILFFPVILFIIILFASSIGLFITPIGLLYGDVSKLIAPALQLLMYLSPVIFAMPKVNEGLFNNIVYANPFTPLINNFRNTILSEPLEQVWYLFILFGVGMVLFSVALVIFKITIPIITERISG